MAGPGGRRDNATRILVKERVARLRGRMGPRGGAVALLVALVVLMVVPLVALPAVRCEVFGGGCRDEPERPKAQPAKDNPRAVPPVEAAVQGRYVALGDSYSAGEGAYGTVEDRAPGNRCHRTSLSYYHAVAKAFDFAKGSAFWACAGATTKDVLGGKAGEPPQIGRVDPDTSLVTISVGGNDAGFSKVLSGCVIKLPFGKGCQGQGGDIATRMSDLRGGLADVLGAVTRRAPSARVIVLGYPRMFSESSGKSLDNIAVSDQQWLNGRARDLNELIRQAVQDADRRIAGTRGRGSVEFVDAYNAFAGHEVGSSDPYINGLSVDMAQLAADAGSFHPTANGYRRMAELFVQQVKTGPGRQLNQFR